MPALHEHDQVMLLECNLDDMTGEALGYAMERILAAGALDAWFTSIYMKKNRPAAMLSVLCRPADGPGLRALILAETTTLGVRRWRVARTVLRRQPHCVTTPWGPVEGKIGWLRDGQPRFSPEFESCRRIATEQHVPLREVYEAAQKAFDPKTVSGGQ